MVISCLWGPAAGTFHCLEVSRIFIVEFHWIFVEFHWIFVEFHNFLLNFIGFC